MWLTLCHSLPCLCLQLKIISPTKLVSETISTSYRRQLMLHLPSSQLYCESSKLLVHGSTLLYFMQIVLKKFSQQVHFVLQSFTLLSLAGATKGQNNLRQAYSIRIFPSMSDLFFPIEDFKHSVRRNSWIGLLAAEKSFAKCLLTNKKLYNATLPCLSADCTSPGFPACLFWTYPGAMCN